MAVCGRRLFRLALTLLLIGVLCVGAFADCADHVFDGGSVELEPTCDTIGILVYTCTECGYAEAAKIGNLGHDYRDGVCTRCGLADPDYVPPVREEAPEETVTLLHTVSVPEIEQPLPAPVVTAPVQTRLVPAAEKPLDALPLLLGFMLLLLTVCSLLHLRRRYRVS